MIDCVVADRLAYAVRSALTVVFLLGAVKRVQQSVGFLRAWTTGCFHTGNRTVWACRRMLAERHTDGYKVGDRMQASEACSSIAKGE